MAKPTNNKKLTALMDFYDAGMPVAEIAELLGLHNSTVHRILIRIGLKEPSQHSSKRLTDEMKVDILKLYQEGILTEQIMAMVGCSKPTIYKYINQAGLSRNVSEETALEAITAYQKTKMTVAEICEQYGLSKATFYRKLKDHTENLL